MAADGLTQWSRFDVPGMWSLLRNVSTADAHGQAGAWQNTYEAAQSLAGRLQWYRDGLAGKWPGWRSSRMVGIAEFGGRHAHLEPDGARAALWRSWRS